MQNEKRNYKQLLQSIGPGLLFASSAIGTSHLVLATRAGAHHGMIYFWIIIGALLLKYPFYEFGPRYANATGHSLLKGYKEEGVWAVALFLLVIFVDMFAVVGAIGAVSAGLLATMFGITGIAVPILAGIVIGITALLLLFGGYKGLDGIVKIISVVLLVTAVTAFLAVLFKGPLEPSTEFVPTPLLNGAGLTLLISLLGWMPAGMEASTMNSIWNVEKVRSTNYRPSLKQTLFDFNLGYGFTSLLALMFLTIGAFTVYGSGVLLQGNATQFSNQLLQIFVQNLGEWSYYVIAIAAFGTIYGTLVTVMDAFPRCFVRAVRVLKYRAVENNEVQLKFLQSWYYWTVVLVGAGGFALFYFSAASMIQILSFATILSFILSPIIAFINLKVIQSKAIPKSHRPSKGLLLLAYVGLIALVGFSIYYLAQMLLPIVM